MHFCSVFPKKGCFLFCNISAFYLGKCYSKTCLKSDVKTSAQRWGFEEQWIGSNLSSVLWLLSLLHWKTSYNYCQLVFGKNGYARLFRQTIHSVLLYFFSYAHTSWSPFLPSVSRVHLLHLQLLLPKVFKMSFGNT